MKNNNLHSQKIIILVSMLVILMMTILLYTHFSNLNPQNEVNSDNFSHILVPADENPGIAYDIKSFSKDNTLILFIPCRADITHLVFYAVNHDGEKINRFEHNFAEGITNILDYNIICMQSNLPSLEVSINDRFGQFKQVNEDPKHETKAYGDLTLTATDYDADTYGFDTIFESHESSSKSHCTMSIKGRGQSSWGNDKKPYLINLEESVSLLNMPKGKKWVLLANTVDHSLLRNEVLFNLAKDLGIEFVPGIQNIDLFVDGEYLGCYSLCSKIEIMKNRVNINKADDYFYRWGIASGEYRELDKTPMWSEDNFVELVNPKSESFNAEAFELAQSTINAIASNDFKQIDAAINVDSYIKYFWLSEISKNTDATIRSVYSYYDSDTEKMIMAAPWDLDRTIGTVEPFGKEVDYLLPTGWCCYSDKWLGMLLANEEFNELAMSSYKEYVQAAYQKCLDELDGRIARITASATMNFTRWDHLERPLESYSNKIAYYMGDSSYASEIGWLKEWLRQRKEWMDGEIG